VTNAATAGVVFGVGRDFLEIPRSDREWIAVGLTLRPGHSGGALVDVQGRLVGINTIMTGPELGMAVAGARGQGFPASEAGVTSTASLKAVQRSAKDQQALDMHQMTTSYVHDP
jgi:S1-C subfamily serine protease